MKLFGSTLSLHKASAALTKLYSPSRSSLRSIASAEAAALPQRHVVVQGASRGIGLQFVKHLLEDQSCHSTVIATCRKPETADDLKSLKDQYDSRLSIVPLDVLNESTIASAAQQVKDSYRHVDLLINTTGILHQSDYPDLPERSISKLKMESMLVTFQTNALGPALVMKYFAPLLSSRPEGEGFPEISKIANLSARVGSIGDNSMGGWYSYRASKTALNQYTRTASIELNRTSRGRPVCCVLLHPGTVSTDLSAPFQKNVKPEKLFSKAYAVSRLMEVVDSLERSHTGKFFAYDGSEIPW